VRNEVEDFLHFCRVERRRGPTQAGNRSDHGPVRAHVALAAPLHSHGGRSRLVRMAPSAPHAREFKLSPTVDGVRLELRDAAVPPAEIITRILDRHADYGAHKAAALTTAWPEGERTARAEEWLDRAARLREALDEAKGGAEKDEVERLEAWLRRQEGAWEHVPVGVLAEWADDVARFSFASGATS
jgi:hypothetical protein